MNILSIIGEVKRFYNDLPFIKRKEEISPEKDKLSRQYTYLLQRLSDIRSNYDFAVQAEAIDSLIYEENAVLAKLSALYKHARAENLTLEIFEQKL